MTVLASTTEDVKAKATAFLMAVSREVEAKLGRSPRTSQQAVWWSPAEPEDQAGVIVSSPGSVSTLRSGGHQREVFDSFRVSALYQINLLNAEFPEQTELHRALTAAGVESQWIAYGFLLPLVAAWCRLPEPFDFAAPDAEALFERFAATVVDGTSQTEHRDVILSLDIGDLPVQLEEGVNIRRVTEEELWELGAPTPAFPPWSLQLAPAEDWIILVIDQSHRHVDASTVAAALYATREAVVADISLVVNKGFTLLPLGMTTEFGPNSLGTHSQGDRMPRQFGSPFQQQPNRALISGADGEQLKAMWPTIKETLRSSSHYLALPLRRLVDGLSRTRVDDKIVDYAIGLEALLTASARDELSYRFALRGAAILAEAGEDRPETFNSLKRFYDARSTIVHGGSLSKLDLHALARDGERFLREVWRWYLAQGLTLRGATNRIDRRILGGGEE